MQMQRRSHQLRFFMADYSSHYTPLLCCFWGVLQLCTHNTSVLTAALPIMRQHTIWSQHTNTILHWCMLLTLLKLHILLGKESLQCGHILSHWMFKSWDRIQFRQVVQASFSLCVPLPCLFPFSHTTFFHCLFSLSVSHSSTYKLKESKHSKKQFNLNAWH